MASAAEPPSDRPPAGDSDAKLAALMESSDAVRSNVKDLVRLNTVVAETVSEMQQEIKALHQAIMQGGPSGSGSPISAPLITYPSARTCNLFTQTNSTRGPDGGGFGHASSKKSIGGDEAQDTSSMPDRESGMELLATEEKASRRSRRHSTNLGLTVMTHGLINFDEAVDMEVNSMGVPSQSIDKENEVVASNLPPNWPRCLEPRKSYSASATAPASVVVKNDFKQVTTYDGSDNIARFRAGSVLRRRCCCSRGCVVLPGSPARMAWDITCVILVMYDLTVIPYTLAWDAEVLALTIGLWCTVSFWTMDIVMSSITGFYRQGTLVMDSRIIFKRYAKTWMPADIFVVACDWFSIIVLVAVPQNKSAGTLKLLRFAKLGRLLRIMDMLRTLRFLRALDEIMERFFIEAYRVIIQITKVLLGCLWCLHVMSCGWFALGKWGPTDTGLHWVEHLTTDSGSHEYFSSFQWSVAQLTLGGMDIPATNTQERCYTIVCLLFGLVFGSTLISALSASMVDFQITQKDRNEKLACARRYLRENAVPSGLSQRVQQQIMERLNEKTRLAESSVHGLHLLARSLRLELRYEITRPRLEQHPLLALWASLDLLAAQQMSESAVTIEYARAGDDVFIAGQDAKACICIQEGELIYVQAPETSPVEYAVETDIKTSDWLAEAALWCESWIHVGTLTTLTPCEMFYIDPEELMKVSDRNVSVRSIVAQYCNQFYRRIVAAAPPSSSWPTDLKVPLTDFASLVLAMPREAQRVVGLCALEVLQAKRKVTEKLRKEVDSGKSVVVMEGQGEVCRVVLVIVLRIEHPDGFVLAHVGKTSDGSLQAECQLPGGKSERDEDATEAVDRLLEAKVGPMVGVVDFCGQNLTTSEKHSKEHGVRTKYLRLVCSMRPKTGSFDGLGWEIDRELGGHQVSQMRLPLPPTPSNIHKEVSRQQSIKSLSSAGNNLHHASQGHLHSRAVYAVPEKGKESTVNYYAWLRDSEIDHYSTTGESSLNDWLVMAIAKMQRQSTNGIAPTSTQAEEVDQVILSEPPQVAPSATHQSSSGDRSFVEGGIWDMDNAAGDVLSVSDDHGDAYRVDV